MLERANANRGGHLDFKGKVQSILKVAHVDGYGYIEAIVKIQGMLIDATFA